MKATTAWTTVLAGLALGTTCLAGAPQAIARDRDAGGRGRPEVGQMGGGVHGNIDIQNRYSREDYRSSDRQDHERRDRERKERERRERERRERERERAMHERRHHRDHDRD